MDREKYKSYTRAVVVALNDYFSREYRNEADPYLAMAKNLLEILAPFVKESVGGSNLTNGTLTVEKID
ncbi:hypothetical protein [Blautia sp.]|uniref:hypothetical protein n=1 Tax=Blautia sp. TaxID=1955243 RepID=UPI00257C793B|nr:hypothetical protein [Blautia sp.]